MTKPPGGHQVDTACPLDCPDSCSLSVSLADGRVVALDGGHANPVTGGYICGKVRRFGERMYGSDRLLRPGFRIGPPGTGAFRWVSWEEALTRVADAMREARDRWGAESVLPYCYGGSNGLLTQDTTDARLFRRFGASRLARTLCASTTGAANQALNGKIPSVTYADYAHAKLVVIWGANPSASGIHLVPFVREAQRAGAALVVVDPRATPLARVADLHLAIRPGTDVAVALALHRHLFENGLADEAFLEAHTTGSGALRARAREWSFERAAEVAGIERTDIARLAGMYADASPAVIRCGWGLERNRNGGNAAAAILALPAVAGKFGVRGGGYTLSNSGSWGIAKSWIDADEPPTRLVNMNHLGRMLTGPADPPVKVLFVYNCNPLSTAPHQNLVRQGLERDDLTTIVFDQVMSDTARYADIVLPATTFLEQYDLARAYGPISLQMVRPVVDAVGEARPNVDVFAELEQRLGLDRPGEPRDELEMMLRVIDGLPEGVGDAVRADAPAAPPFGTAPVQFVDVFPRTPDGRVHLFPEDLDRQAPLGLYTYQPDPATDRYPLALISPSNEKAISSSLYELVRKPAALTIHPEDAHAREIGEGDTVRVFNELGAVTCLAAVSPTVRPGTVTLPKGLWSRHTLNGSTANALTPDTLADIGAGACFNDARVQVERAAGTADRDPAATGAERRPLALPAAEHIH
ncbi:MAG TPA: molybdopterin-dependent oxidoreductase [Vicinamibacterales bacterium]|nr:molybdopterin-dependent oxidoreductase [Vicinamibacterales bacterium]